MKAISGWSEASWWFFLHPFEKYSQVKLDSMKPQGFWVKIQKKSLKAPPRKSDGVELTKSDGFF